MKIEAASVEKEGIELILNILSNIITAKIDVMYVNKKSTTVQPNKTEKHADPSPSSLY